jgi:hypothetical protein
MSTWIVVLVVVGLALLLSGALLALAGPAVAAGAMGQMMGQAGWVCG